LLCCHHSIDPNITDESNHFSGAASSG